jgi:hypothetical protein
MRLTYIEKLHLSIALTLTAAYSQNYTGEPSETPSMHCCVLPRAFLAMWPFGLGAEAFATAPKLERSAPKKKMPPIKVRLRLIRLRR